MHYIKNSLKSRTLLNRDRGKLLAYIGWKITDLPYRVQFNFICFSTRDLWN